MTREKAMIARFTAWGGYGLNDSTFDRTWFTEVSEWVTNVSKLIYKAAKYISDGAKRQGEKIRGCGTANMFELES